MNTRELGRTGKRIPEVGLGTWRYRGDAEVLRKGIDAGATFIDTAENYGTEGIVGEAIRGRRDGVFVATKTDHWKYDEVLRSADASLSRLGVETIDLYQLHWPYAGVPIGETMSAMGRLVDEGQVRFIGVSNFTVRELAEAQASLGNHGIVSNQVRYSLVDRTIETELLPYCERHGITVIAYSPLASGIRRIGQADRHGVLERVSREANRTIAQVALNWCLRHPHVLVIPKTASADHIVENCGASGWRLNEAQIQALNRGVRFERRSRVEIGLRRSVRRVLQRTRRRAPGRG